MMRTVLVVELKVSLTEFRIDPVNILLDVLLEMGVVWDTETIFQELV